MKINYCLQRSSIVVLLLFLSCLIPSSEAALYSGIDADVLNRAGLDINFQLKLPIKETEKVAKMLLFGNYLYVLTSDNYLFCVDSQKGTIRFDTQLTAPGLPVSTPSYYDGKLWYMVGTELMVLNPSMGAVTFRRDLSRVGKDVIYGPVRNEGFVYAAGSDKRIHAFVADEYWQKFAVTAQDDSLITSFVADEKLVHFCTISGNVVCIFSDGAKRIWQYDVSGKIVAPVVRDGRWLYVSAKDTKLYKLEAYKGTAGWEHPFHAENPLINSVQIGRDIIYQPAGEKGLYAINKEDGKKLWQVENGRAVVAEIADRAYVFTNISTLLIMDNNTAQPIQGIDLAGASEFVSNIIGSVVYVSDDRGVVTSIGKLKR